MTDPKDDAILKLGRNRVLAHKVLFKDRHSDETPDFHTELITAWHSSLPRVNTMAFREGGKTTVAEEALALATEYKLFHNCIIVGNTEKRACERLTAIKHELSTNEFLNDLFGEHSERTAKVWNDAEIILNTNVRVAALGRGQSLRGTKYLQWRPDYLFCDDIEEVEKGQHYSDEEAFETVRWFYKVLIAALDKNARIRVNSTPLSKQSLPMVLSRDSDWVTHTYPIEHMDARGHRRATWPSRYPLDWIDKKKESFARVGLLNDYMQEYMCVAEDPSVKFFRAEMFRVEPRVHTWQPVYAMYDPARTTKATSATTGWAVWSWVANRLVIWDGGGELWKPDQLINHIFEINDKYSPVEIGVEEDGLNEFILQPLRHAQLQRNTLIPLRALKAPRGKIGFIEGLQPFFLAGEVSFAKPLDGLVSQFLSFPTGRIDGPNALAYAPRMRPGVVVYENFSATNVADDLAIRARAPIWLALNASQGLTTAIACQLVDGALHVLEDYVREGDPGQVLESMVTAATLSLGELRLVAGDRHYGGWDHLGLRGAVARLPAELRHGGSETVGRDEIRALLQRQVRGAPALRVATRAHWTLNAFSAGYARAVDKRGVVQEEARDGVYRTLMEGLEAFTALMKIGTLSDSTPNVRVTEGGQIYVSALPSKHAQLPAKDRILDPGAVSDFSRSARR